MEITQIKKEAKDFSKNNNIQYMKALDIISTKYGYKDFNSLNGTVKKTDENLIKYYKQIDYLIDCVSEFHDKEIQEFIRYLLNLTIKYKFYNEKLNIMYFKDHLSFFEEDISMFKKIEKFDLLTHTFVSLEDITNVAGSSFDLTVATILKNFEMSKEIMNIVIKKNYNPNYSITINFINNEIIPLYGEFIDFDIIKSLISSEPRDSDPLTMMTVNLLSDYLLATK